DEGGWHGGGGVHAGIVSCSGRGAASQCRRRRRADNPGEATPLMRTTVLQRRPTCRERHPMTAGKPLTVIRNRTFDELQIGEHIAIEQMRFLAPVSQGESIALRIEVVAKDPATRRVTLACVGTRRGGAAVLEGEADVIVSDERIEGGRTSLPEIRGDATGRPGLQQLLAHVATLEPIPVAVVHPCDAASLSAALDARDAGLMRPVLVAPRARLEAVA